MSPLLVRVEGVTQLLITFDRRIVVLTVSILVVNRNLQPFDGLELHFGRQITACRITVRSDTLT